jgi:hypothetical protein
MGADQKTISIYQKDCSSENYCSFKSDLIVAMLAMKKTSEMDVS